MFSDARLTAELDMADAAIAQMRTTIARMQTIEADVRLRTAEDAGLLDPQTYSDALAQEQRACVEIDDAISIVEIDLERELSREEELRLYAELRSFAAAPGDLIGKLDDRRYQLAFPWNGAADAARMQGFVAGIVADALPGIESMLGRATCTNATPAFSAIPMQPAPARAPIVKTMRSR